MSIKSVMPAHYFILCYSLLLLPSIFPSLRVFSNESALHTRWPKYWNFSFSVSPSLPMNIQGWFPLGLTGLISLCPRDSQESSLVPQFESTNSSVLRLLYSPTLTSIHDDWKNLIALTIQTFVGTVMSLLFNMLSRFIIAFLPRSKHFLKFYLFFNWRIIALQNFLVFCQKHQHESAIAVWM